MICLIIRKWLIYRVLIEVVADVKLAVGMHELG